MSRERSRINVTTAHRKPDFLIVGAQKAGTTWLWKMLDEHPATMLPAEKEIHYFGSSELYAKGPDWYYERFADIGQERVTGEASTSYLSERMPFFFASENELQYDDTLPKLPELVATQLPDVKIIVSLRDPVRRAISAYSHWMRKGRLSVSAGLRRTVEAHPRLRILEMGDYSTHLGAWFDVFPREQILVQIFEDDICTNAVDGLRRTFKFLGIDSSFTPPGWDERVHKSWNWTRIVANYYAGPFRSLVNSPRAVAFMLKHDWFGKFGKFGVSGDDIEFLRDFYLPSRERVRALAGRDLTTWRYGEDLLTA